MSIETAIEKVHTALRRGCRDAEWHKLRYPQDELEQALRGFAFEILGAAGVEVKNEGAPQSED